MQISMKGVLSGEIGYPLDISLSPDGTMLTGSYMYIEDGTLRSRVAFYNFSEVGKNALNRFVGGFHDIYKESIVPRVQYLDDVYSVAFAQVAKRYCRFPKAMGKRTYVCLLHPGR